MSRLSASLAASWLATSLVVTPSFALAAPPRAVPVQDVDDLFVDDDLLTDDDEEEAPKRKPARKPAKPAPEPEPELDDEMPAGDGDMPMGDYDLEHGAPAPAPEPEPEPEPVEPVAPVEPEPATTTTTTRPSSSSSGRRLIGAEEPEPGREVLTETEELPTMRTEEPEDAGSGALVWVITGVGAAVGVAALAGLGVGGYFLLGGAGGPSGSVTVTPH